MPQHRYTSKTCQVKEVNHKRPHTVWLHLYGMSRKGKSIQLESRFMITWDQGWGKWLQRNVIEFWSNGNILHLKCGGLYTHTHTHICQNSLTPHTWWILLCVNYILNIFSDFLRSGRAHLSAESCYCWSFCIPSYPLGTLFANVSTDIANPQYRGHQEHRYTSRWKELSLIGNMIQWEKMEK